MKKRLSAAALALSALIALICFMLALYPRDRKAPDVIALRPLVHTAMRPMPPSGPIAVNSADKQALETLPGIGPHLAELIIRARERSPFFYPEDMKAVKGIGDKRLQQILPHINLD